VVLKKGKREKTKRSTHEGGQKGRLLLSDIARTGKRGEMGKRSIKEEKLRFPSESVKRASGKETREGRRHGENTSWKNLANIGGEKGEESLRPAPNDIAERSRYAGVGITKSQGEGRIPKL